MAYGGVAPNAFTSGSPTACKWVATAWWLKGSRTHPSAPTAARFTCCPVWLAIKTRAVRGAVLGGKSLVCSSNCSGEAFQCWGSPSTREIETTDSPSTNGTAGRLVAPGATASSATRRHPAASASVVAGPAVGPSAAQGHIHAKPQPAAFAGGVAHVIQHRPTQERLVHQAFSRVIDHLRIHEGQFHPADSVCLHLFQFAPDLGLLHRQPEPPPPHHGLCARGRMGKLRLKFLERRLCMRRAQRYGAQQNPKKTRREQKPLKSHGYQSVREYRRCR